jgi:hypothetical protein
LSKPSSQTPTLLLTNPNFIRSLFGLCSVFVRYSPIKYQFNPNNIRFKKGINHERGNKQAGLGGYGKYGRRLPENTKDADTNQMPRLKGLNNQLSIIAVVF